MVWLGTCWVTGSRGDGLVGMWLATWVTGDAWEWKAESAIGPCVASGGISETGARKDAMRKNHLYAIASVYFASRKLTHRQNCILVGGPPALTQTPLKHTPCTIAFLHLYLERSMFW